MVSSLVNRARQWSLIVECHGRWVDAILGEIITEIGKFLSYVARYCREVTKIIII